MRDHLDTGAAARRDDPTLAGNAEPRLRQLGKSDDYEVADGNPDIRGWRVFDADGNAVGTVHELIADLSAMQVRYADVQLDGDGADRHVLVPIGATRLSGEVNAVTVRDLRRVDLERLPRFDHEEVDREFERRVRVAMGDAAAADVQGEDFYRHAHFDTTRCFDGRSEGGPPAFYALTDRRPGGGVPPPGSRRR